MQFASGITDIAHGIQLAVAPVFLLSGVATTLSVLTNRLGRIIDRARLLEALPSATTAAADAQTHAELRTLSRRAQWVHRAIILSTSCALLICLVIVTIFVAEALGKDLSVFIMVLFIAALAAFVGGLLSFLLEIQAATASLHFRPRPRS